MPNETLAALFKSPSLKITNTTQGSVVLVPMRAVKVRLKFPSKAMYHMLEDGNTVVDQRILMPIGVDLELIAPSSDLLEQATNILMDRASLFTIQSRGIILQDMRVNYQALDQTPEMISATPMKFQFMQLLYQGQKNAITLQSADSSVLDRGISALTSSTKTASGLFDSVKGAISALF